MSTELGVDDVVSSLRAYVLEELLNAEDISDIDPEENLISNGFIDSTGAVRLAMHIEQLYGIEVQATDFTIENFRTLNTIAALVREKREAQ